MELSKGEAARIRTALGWAAGSADLSQTVQEDARFRRSEVRSLLNAWDKMSLDAQAMVQAKMAALASPDIEDTGNFDVEPDLLDLGAALRSLIEDGAKRRGQKVRVVGLDEAARAAVAVWQDRNPGHPVEVGQLYREKGGKARHPYPLLTFVADAMEQVLSPEEMVAATAMRRPERIDVERAFDTKLRALREIGAI